jgi:hypothetical protein
MRETARLAELANTCQLVVLAQFSLLLLHVAHYESLLLLDRSEDLPAGFNATII